MRARRLRPVERCPHCDEPRAVVMCGEGCGCVLAFCGCQTSPRMWIDGGCNGCVVRSIAMRRCAPSGVP